MTRKSDPIPITKRPDQTDDEARAAKLMGPVIRAAAATQATHNKMLGPDLTIGNMARALRAQADAVNQGDLSGIERVLVTQVNSLDLLFNFLLQRGMSCTSLDQLKVDLGLALKAQRQCTLAAATLAEMKNPTGATFIRQANVAQQQVVQNGPRTGENQNRHNEVLGVTHEHIERLDPGAPGTASGANPTLETVGEVHRPTDTRRQSQGRGKSEG